MIGELLHTGKNSSKARHWEQIWFVPNTVADSGGVAIPGTFCSFYPRLSMETLFPAVKLTQKCYVNMTISFFFENWQFTHELGLPLSLLQTYYT